MKLQDARMRIRLIEAGMLDWNADAESNRRALAAMLAEMERLAAIERVVTRLKRDLTETNETLPRELVSFNPCPIAGDGPVDAIAATVERVMARHTPRQQEREDPHPSPELWIVAKVLSHDGRMWELVAVCDSRDRAVAACRDWRHCIWPMELNDVRPDKTEIHPSAEFPIPRPIDPLAGRIIPVINEEPLAVAIARARDALAKGQG